MSVPSTTLLELLRNCVNQLLDYKLCTANRWKCESGHEWISAHGGVWLQMTRCPECGGKPIAHRGHFQTFGEKWDEDMRRDQSSSNTPGHALPGRKAGGQ